MHLIVGLGNPGEEYRDTRHNVGFLLVEELLRRHGGGRLRREGGCLVARAKVDGVETLLVEPQGYMNLSGRPVAELQRRHELTPGAILVAHDEMDLELGRVQLRRSGGTAGHRGLESVREALGTDRFARARLGIGRPHASVDPADYVLTTFKRSEKPAVEEMLDWAAEGVACYVREGIEAAMNRFNRWPRVE